MAGGYNAAFNPFFPTALANAVTATFLGDNTPIFRFQEGFASSWKAKNLTEFLVNGTFASSITGGSYQYNGGLENHTSPSGDNVQNVPGAIYNTESGFEYNHSNIIPSPNPPPGFGTTAVSPGGANNDFGGTGNGLNNAGVADHGTRLALSLTNIPNGVAAFVPPIIYLYRQGNSLTTKGPNGDPTLYLAGFSTGVMVLTNTDANGGGSFSGPSSLPTNSTPQAYLPLAQVQTSGLVVYEILYTILSAWNRRMSRWWFPTTPTWQPTFRRLASTPRRRAVSLPSTPRQLRARPAFTGRLRMSRASSRPPRRRLYSRSALALATYSSRTWRLRPGMIRASQSLIPPRIQVQLTDSQGGRRMGPSNSGITAQSQPPERRRHRVRPALSFRPVKS